MAKNPFIRKGKEVHVLIPQSGIGKSIVMVLAEEPNLRLKQIYIRVLRHQQRSFSYQALHKKIQCLMDEGILTRKNDIYYYINPYWLDQLAQFVQITQQKFKMADQTIDESVAIQEIRDYYKNKYYEQGEKSR